MIYAVGIVIILTPMVWTRNIAKLSWAYLMGVVMLLVCYVVVVVFCAKQMSEQGGLGPGIVPINE